MIDIYSNSWGPGDLGWQVKGPGVLASKAIELGIQKVSLLLLSAHKISFIFFADAILYYFSDYGLFTELRIDSDEYCSVEKVLFKEI